MHPALRLFRSLLWLYPAEFREHFGQDMSQLLADRLREEREPLGALLAWCHAAAGVLIHAPEEHMQMILQDVKYAWRAMRREKMPAIAAVLVLAIGIGSTTAIFTLVNGVLLRPLPFAAPEQLVYVTESGPVIGGGAVAYPNYLDLRERNHSLEDFALYTDGITTLQISNEAERIPSGQGTASLFRVLGVRPLLGRWFTEDEDRHGGPAVVALGEDLWRRRFNGDPGVIGRTVKLGGGTEARIVAVMPRDFHFPGLAELWTPLQLDPRNNTRTDHWLEGIGRLKSGVAVAQAQAEFRALMNQIEREHPLESYGQTVNVFDFGEHANRRLRPILVTLLGAVGFVLLIACANLMSLLLVKASARAREMAVRGALGASRSRLVRGFVMESVLLGLMGASGGVLLAWAAVPALAALVPEGTLPRWISFTPDWRVGLFVAAVAAGSGILAGLIPAFSASRQNVVESLKEGGRTSTGGAGTAWLRSALVIGEIAASVLLLVGAGLMVRTLVNLQNRQTGFRTDQITTLQVTPSQREDPATAAARVDRIREELATIPGVLSAAGTSAVPLMDNWGRSLTVEGRPVLSLKDAPMIQHTVVTPGYFRTLGVPLLQGRDFDDRDGKQPPVAIVDEELAKRYWPGESAVGKRVRFGPPEANEPWHTVVGVVGVAYNNSLRELSRNGVYLPYREFNMRSLAFVVHTGAGNPEASIRARLRAFDRTLAISRVITMRQVVTRVLWQEGFFATLAVAFGAMALIMALVGLYGVMSYTVSRRAHEMGIRMALGATAAGIRRMVLVQSAKLIAAGLVLGTMAALVMAEFTPSLGRALYGVTRTDPATLAAVAGLLALTALAASLVPAQRATDVDPIAALRRE